MISFYNFLGIFIIIFPKFVLLDFIYPCSKEYLFCLSGTKVLLTLCLYILVEWPWAMGLDLGLWTRA